MAEDIYQPEAKRERINSDRKDKTSQPMSNSTVYTVQSLSTPKTTNDNTGSSQVTNISTNLNKLTTTQYIKIESEEEHSVEKNVPVYDFNKSHTVRIHPVNQETNTGLKQCD